MLVNVGHDFLLFYANYDYLYNHFISGPYLDLTSRFLAAGGTLLALVRVRERRYWHLLLAYALLAVGIGVTTPYAYAATTRGIFFIPFGAAFAGIALDALTAYLSVPRLAYALLFTIWGVNILQSQVGVFEQVGYPATGLIVRELQLAHERGISRLVLVRSAQYPYANAGVLPVLQQAYGLQDMQLVVVTPSQVRCESLPAAEVLYFSDDTAARHALTCPSSARTSIVALAPAYLL